MVHRAVLRFYAELNDCVPASQRQRDLEIPLSTPLDVRALLAKLGVLPDVVELVLLNPSLTPL
jgi:hypothetical protein